MSEEIQIHIDCGEEIDELELLDKITASIERMIATSKEYGAALGRAATASRLTDEGLRRLYPL